MHEKLLPPPSDLPVGSGGQCLSIFSIVVEDTVGADPGGGVVKWAIAAQVKNGVSVVFGASCP